MKIHALRPRIWDIPMLQFACGNSTRVIHHVKMSSPDCMTCHSNHEFLASDWTIIELPVLLKAIGPSVLRKHVQNIKLQEIKIPQ